MVDLGEGSLVSSFSLAFLYPPALSLGLHYYLPYHTFTHLSRGQQKIVAGGIDKTAPMVYNRGMFVKNGIRYEVYHCLRCGRDFVSSRYPPKRCGKCKSPYWDKERGK